MLTEEELRIEVESKVLGNSVQNGWDINPDLKQLHKLYAGLVKNLIKHGKMYCPCAVILPASMAAGTPRDISGYICPCIHAKTDIETKGNCKCRLFFKKQDTKAQD